jgi:hypothetical protein
MNANYMIPQPPSDELMAAALFCDPKRRSNSYACFLELQVCARRTGSVVLPVDTTSQDMLFGAPKTSSTGSAEIIRNTRHAHETIDKKHRGREFTALTFCSH